MKRKRFVWSVLACMASFFTVIVGTASAVQYEYDALNRLTRVYSGTGESIQYQYDATGNLLRAAVTTGDSIDVLPNTLLTREVTTGDSMGILPNLSHTEEATTGDTVNMLPSTLLIGEITTSDSINVLPMKESWIEGVATGWTPFFTKGVTANYSVASKNESNLTVQRLIVESERPGAANVYRDFSVKKQQSYTISGWIAAEKVEHAAGQIVVNYYDEKNHFIGHENVVNVLQSSEWKPFTSTLSIPNGTVKARVHLQGLILQADGSGNFGFAALTFEPNSPI